MQVDQIGEAIDRQIATPLVELSETASYAARAANAAEDAAAAVGYDVNAVKRLVRELEVWDLQDGEPESLAARVAKQRRIVAHHS